MGLKKLGIWKRRKKKRKERKVRVRVGMKRKDDKRKWNGEGKSIVKGIWWQGLVLLSAKEEPIEREKKRGKMNEYHSLSQLTFLNFVKY